MISTAICVSLRIVWHLSSVITCHVSVHCLGSFLLQSMLLKICFEVSTYLLSRDKIWNLPWTFCLLYLHSNSILWRLARLLLELFASTVGCFLSWIKYLPSYVFLKRCPSFTPQWWGQNNPTQWFSCSRRRNALGNMPLVFVSCLSISNKSLDVLSSTCFLSKFWYLQVACTIYLSVA